MDPRWTGIESELNRQMREVALTHDGVLTAEDLTAIGLTRKMIQTRKESGRLIPVLKGSFALPGTRLRLRGRCRAGVCSAGEGTVVSHSSALALHDVVRDPGVVHLTGVSRGSGGTRSGRWSSDNYGFKVIRHETRQLPDSQITVVNGIPTTTVERALRDFAAEATPAEMTKALTQGEKERAICWGTLRELVADSAGHKGNTMLSTEIEGWNPAFVDTGSDPEIDFLRMIRKREMPWPAVNVKLGHNVPDFLWWHLRLAVELDPYGTHSGAGSHRRDHRKGIELETMGLRVVRFTGEDLYQHEDRTGDELWIVIRQQSRLLRCPIFLPPGSPLAEVPQIQPLDGAKLAAPPEASTV